MKGTIHTPFGVARYIVRLCLNFDAPEGIDMFVDCIGRSLKLGDRVGVAFSYSRASVGYIRIGTIEVLSNEEFKMRWEQDDKVSPPMAFNEKRMVLL
jgi:hypothetical protein